MRIAIVDDVLQERRRLYDFVTVSAAQSRVEIELKQFESGNDFLDDAEALYFDIVFLDIYMDGLTGMKVAERLREQGSESLIIFCTTSDKFALQSYDVDAFYYLLKPYDQAKIKSVFDKALNACDGAARYISVKENKIFRNILLSDIIYVDYYNHYTHIHLENEVVKTYGNFKEVGNKLEPYAQFLLCYRNIMINMNYVSMVEPLSFAMKNGDILPMNRKEKHVIRQKYADFIFAEMTQGGSNDI